MKKLLLIVTGLAALGAISGHFYTRTQAAAKPRVTTAKPRVKQPVTVTLGVTDELAKPATNADFIGLNDSEEQFTKNEQEARRVENHFHFAKAITTPAKYNQVLNGIYSTTLKRPTVIKANRSGLSVLQVQVPYHIEMMPGFHPGKNRHFYNISKLIRLKTGEQVWQAQPVGDTVFNDDHRTSDGIVKINLPISPEYPEKQLRDFTLQYLTPTGATTSVIYTLS